MGNTVLQRLEDLAGGVDRRATGCGAGTLPDIAARGFGLKMETPQDGASGQAVLLVDLENMVGQKARSSVLSSRMDALLACVDPYTPVVAACAGSRIGAESRRYLRERGVKLLVSDDGKDAADTMLLAEAQRLAQLGVRYFVVASGDRAFAKVADFGQLEVVLWKSQPPKKTNATSIGHTECAGSNGRWASASHNWSLLGSARRRTSDVPHSCPLRKALASQFDRRHQIRPKVSASLGSRPNLGDAFAL